LVKTATNGQGRDPERKRAGLLQRVYDRHWVLIGSSVLLVGAVIAALLLVWPGGLAGVGIGAVVVLFFTAVGLNVFSSEEDMTSGEVQRAITFAVLYAYFGLFSIATMDHIDSASFLGRILDNFWMVVLSVVGFYFGGRIIDQIKAPLKNPVNTLLGDAVWEARKKIREGLSAADVQAELAVVERLQPILEREASLRGGSRDMPAPAAPLSKAKHSPSAGKPTS
jgi:hypothetical protein